MVTMTVGLYLLSSGAWFLLGHLSTHLYREAKSRARSTA